METGRICVRPSPWLVVVLVGAAIGITFAAFSTYDFVQYLDRQDHSVTCSFNPLAGKDTGETGCKVAMMSEYSSVFRTKVWGGVPIALPALAVFAFIGLFAIDLALTRRKSDPRATAFLAAAAALPALVSVIMLYISLSKLGTTCKLCVAIYTASALCLLGGIMVWREAVRDAVIGGAVRPPGPPGTPKSSSDGSGARLEAIGDTAPATNGFLATAFGIGVAFVLIPVFLYLSMAPDHSKFIGTCEGLAQPNDVYNVMVPVDRRGGTVRAIELLDPLCPACKAFEARLEQSGYADRLARKAILFPLDKPCNWMIAEATHPGACTVSEAVLCAGDRAPDVIAWAFQVQDQIRAAAKTDPTAAARFVKERFPDLATCVGSPEAQSRLNQSLRWAVANNVRVLTPQLYIVENKQEGAPNSTKLCDEDVDLGLDFTLSRMIERYHANTLFTAPPPPLAKPLERMPAPETGSAKPAGDKPAGDKPATDTAAGGTVPATDTGSAKPPTDKPAEPGAGSGATDKPADKPPADKPPADKPPADKPPADKPPADKPADKPAEPAAPAPTDDKGGTQ